MLETLQETANRTEHLRRIGRYMSAEMLLEVGDTPYFVEIDRGEIKAVRQGPFKMRRWDFAIRADREVWDKFWSPAPPPGFQDIFAMARFGHARLEGNLDPMLANLRYVKELIALPRRRNQPEAGR